MLETYKMFSNIRVAEYSGLTNEQLALAYQAEDLKPEILAEMYCRNYAILYKVSSKYFSINDDDKASIIVMDLNDTMQYYSEDNGVKYLTFALYSITEKLSVFVTKQHRKKRILVGQELSLDNITEDNDSSIGDNTYFENICDERGYDLTELSCVINVANLTLNEKKVCYLYMSNTYTKDEIAEKLNVTRQTVYHIIASLQNKLKPILNIF